MNVLDSDETVLQDMHGNKAERDIVQFVPFNQFSGNPFKLREEVLKELPNQVLDYYLRRKIKPQQGKLFGKFVIFRGYYDSIG